MLEKLDYILSVLAVHRSFYIWIAIISQSTLSTQQTTFFNGNNALWLTARYYLQRLIYIGSSIECMCIYQ